MATDALVIGSGVVGLAVARGLARRGLSVEVLTRDQPGSGASSASAGMLEVHFPAPVPPELSALCLPSRAMYGDFTQALLEESGVDIELDLEGTLTLATDAAELTAMREQAAAIPGSRLLADHPLWTAMEPALSPSLTGALFLPDDHHVNPRRLCEALLVSCERAGARFIRGITVRKILRENGRAAGVETDSGIFRSGLVVNAAGSWAGQLEGLPVPLPVRPVRGQILVLRPRTPLRFVLHGPSVYAVPRRDGTILLGATVEEAGYNEVATAGGVAGLLAEGIRLVPPLREAVLEEVRVGLRPGTPDTFPILGESGLPGFLLASGPFRKGILLAPVIGETIAALAGGRKPPVPLNAYSPARFGKS
jgi:glycine oxidase